MFDISPQRQKYLDAKGKVVLNACPGSGKTTTIAHKIHQLIENEYKDSNKGIVCLSFTNVAKDEIHQKYSKISGKNLRHPHLVSTIDSFINSFITLPFYYVVAKQNIRPSILEDSSLLDFYWQNRHGYRAINNQPLIYIYKPSGIFRNQNGELTYNGNLPDTTKVNLGEFIRYGRDLKKWQFEKGILTNSDSAYVALQLLKNHPRIAENLIQRFDYVIIDEAQDTSDVQHSIFSALAENGLKNIELVGDPYQTLYEWRDATPKAFIEKYNSADWLGLDLFENWRSTSSIVNCYSTLRKSKELPIEAKKKVENELPINVIQYEKGKESEAIKKYQELCREFKENHVVVRGNELAEYLNGNQSSKLDFWKDNNTLKLVKSILQYQRKDIKKAIDSFRQIMIDFSNPLISYEEKQIKIRELKTDYNYNALLLKWLSELSDFELTLNDWTKLISAKISSFLKLDPPIKLELKTANTGQINYKGFHPQKMNVLFCDKQNNWDVPITTIHQVKGKTLDSILIFFNSKSLTISDFVTPTEELTEKQRMIYVAMSRPRYLLVIAIAKSISKTLIKSKFGENCVIH